MKKTISGLERRAISRTIPDKFDEKEFITNKETPISEEEISSETSNQLKSGFDNLVNEFDILYNRFRNNLDTISFPLEDFDEGTIKCIQSIFGNTLEFNEDMYFKLLDLQIELSNSIASEELVKQGIL